MGSSINRRRRTSRTLRNPETCGLCKIEPSIVLVTEKKYKVGDRCWRKLIRRMPHWDNTTTSVDIKKAIGLIE